MLPGNSNRHPLICATHPARRGRRPNLRKHRGTTLIELTIVLVIVAILADLGAQGWSAFYRKHQSNRVARDLVAAIHLARSSSAMHRQWTTLCPSADGDACTPDWGAGILVFLDADRDGEFGPRDRTIHRFQPAVRGSRLSWRSFRNKPYLQMTPRGRTNQQNGSFIYCPPDADPHYARIVIVNKLGHARQGRDRNGDGIPETASGKPVQCHENRD